MCKSFIGSMLLAAAVLLPAGCGKKSDKQAAGVAEKQPLVCHVGGTMRPIIEKIAKEYEKKTGQKVEINSADSGELLAHIELQKEGDLYVCHAPFMGILMQRGLGVDGWVIGELYPVIIVQKGNPKNIKGLQDLTRDDVSLYVTDYKFSTLGRMLKTIFAKAGISLDELRKKKKIETNKSGAYVANIIKTKNADAGLVWDVVAKLRSDGLDVVKIDDFLPTPGVDMVTSATGKSYSLAPVKVSISTLKCSKQQEAAAKFAEFLTSPEHEKAFRDAGYRVNPALVGQKYKEGKLIK